MKNIKREDIGREGNDSNKRGSFDSFWNGNFCFDSLLNDFVCLGLDP